jgi:hypothetical protein
LRFTQLLGSLVGSPEEPKRKPPATGETLPVDLLTKPTQPSNAPQLTLPVSEDGTNVPDESSAFGDLQVMPFTARNLSQVPVPAPEATVAGPAGPLREIAQSETMDAGTAESQSQAPAAAFEPDTVDPPSAGQPNRSGDLIQREEPTPIEIPSGTGLPVSSAPRGESALPPRPGKPETPEMTKIGARRATPALSTGQDPVLAPQSAPAAGLPSGKADTASPGRSVAQQEMTQPETEVSTSRPQRKPGKAEKTDTAAPLVAEKPSAQTATPLSLHPQVDAPLQDFRATEPGSATAQPTELASAPDNLASDSGAAASLATPLRQPASDDPARLPELAFAAHLTAMGASGEETRPITANTSRPSAATALSNPRGAIPTRAASETVEPAAAPGEQQPDETPGPQSAPKDPSAAEPPEPARRPELPRAPREQAASAAEAPLAGQAHGAATNAATNATNAADPPEVSSRPKSPAPATRVELPAEPVKPAPVARDLRFELSGGDRKVEVRLTDRGGEVHVAVRTGDAQLAGDLREDLPALAARLEQGGFRAETWRPGQDGATEQQRPEYVTVFKPDNARGQTPQHGREDQDQRQPQQQKDSGNPPNRKQERKEFTWLYTSLR